MENPVVNIQSLYGRSTKWSTHLGVYFVKESVRIFLLSLLEANFNSQLKRMLMVALE